MVERNLPGRNRLPSAADPDRAAGNNFRLVRYFTLTSLLAFAVVGVALFILQGMEQIFFTQVQREQAAFFAQVQEDLTRQHDTAARANLIAVHEVGHVNLTRLFANVLWASDFAPFVARVQQLPIDHCRRLADGGKATGVGTSPRRACFAELGARIRALPGFAAIDAKAQATMRDSTVFKIKVFDLRGITVYSSEHAQIGEDAIGNRGWINAAAGRVASELTHRDRFSAFERVVENRDLISSYLPVVAPGSDRLLGVFEIYSDVTPLLDQIKQASARLAALTTANQVRVEQVAREDQRKVDENSDRLLAIIGGLFALLYLALLVLVRHGQKTIDRQAQAQERATHREAVWHREKMAALAAMAANVSHEVGNPLATITAIAEDIRAEKDGRSDCSRCQPETILRETRRIAQMTRQIADFAVARSESPELVDLNQMIKAVCDFLSFDRRFRTTQIEFRAGERLPACLVVPDHLNEVLMTLFQACTDGRSDNVEVVRRPIAVATRQEGADIVITIVCPGSSTDAEPAERFGDSRFELARRRIVAMGGKFSASATKLEITLPAASDEVGAG